MRQQRTEGQQWLSPAQQTGVTLIELMVAMVIGLILSGTVIQIFIGSNETYRFQESLSRIQENGRYALSTLARDLRQADYKGCAGGCEPGEDCDLRDDQGGGASSSDPAGMAPLSDGVMGYTYDSGWKPSLDTALDSTIISKDNDVLRLRSLDFGPSGDVNVSDSEEQSSGANLFVDETRGFEKDDVVLATNCEKSVIFQINNSPNGGAGQLTVPGIPQFHDRYEPHTVTQGFQNRFFYIDSSDTEPTLIRQNQDGTTDELAIGVERMALVYGEDTNDDFQVDSYETADNVTDWDDVVAVRVSLLVRGPEDNVTDEEQSVSFPPGEDPVTFGDKRLRQVFTTTVSLRNRLQ